MEAPGHVPSVPSPKSGTVPQCDVTIRWVALSTKCLILNTGKLKASSATYCI